MRLLLDSAGRDAWAEWLPGGLFHGITTNPLILARAGIPCRLPDLAALARDALAHGIEELHLQSWGGTRQALAETGLALAALDPRVVVKLPATREGVGAVATLHAAGVPVTLTAIHAPQQVVAAAALGVRYAAPYYGRIGDQGHDAPAALAAMRGILRAGRSRTRLLVASLRAAADLATLAAAGQDCFTLGPAVAAELFADGATEAAAAAFEQAARG